jgi:putative DNA methylase
VFSVHGFPTGLVRCESNILGIRGASGANVGSGGWLNVMDKYAKAKDYCDRPFEVLHKTRGKEQVVIPGEWIGDIKPGRQRRRIVDLRCANAADVALEPGSLDGVFTDPPYFGSVQYAELMDYCYVWLRGLVGNAKGFERPSTRDSEELTGNETMARDLQHFAEGLSAVFRRFSTALKPGAPFVFTYHHNRVEAYYPVVIAILDAGLVCTASLPCPAEMGASIHIKGTGSSVVDSVFVSRSTGRVPRAWVATSSSDIAQLVSLDVARLSAAGLNVSPGDIRCVVYGHLARLAVWNLRASWQMESAFAVKVDEVSKSMSELGGLDGVLQHFDAAGRERVFAQSDFFRESHATYAIDADAICF